MKSENVNPHIYHGEYIGPIEKLKGKTAIIRFETNYGLLAQFDDFAIPTNWYWFAESDFKIYEESEDAPA